MDEIQKTIDLFNQYFGEELPVTGSAATNTQPDNAATDVKPDVRAVWNDILFGATGMSLQPQLPPSMLLKTPAITLEELGLQNPFVLEPTKAGGGFSQYASPGFANTPVAPQPIHRRQTGARRARNICDVCKGEFNRPSTLRTHIRSHTGERPYKCDYPGCSKRFSVLSNQRRHTKTHLKLVLPRDECSSFKALDVSTEKISKYHCHSDPIH